MMDCKVCGEPCGDVYESPADGLCHAYRRDKILIRQAEALENIGALLRAFLLEAHGVKISHKKSQDW